MGTEPWHGEGAGPLCLPPKLALFWMEPPSCEGAIPPPLLPEGRVFPRGVSQRVSPNSVP